MRLDGYGVDFEDFLLEDVVLPSYTSQVRGIMGAITPSASAEVKFKFRVGNAQHANSLKRCDYSGVNCYKAKAVGTIESISASSGYTTGG